MTAADSPSFAGKTSLVTGANSGLGFEAAAQLAEAGCERVVLACRTLEKAEVARQALIERVGTDPFESVAIDVANIESSNAAADELIERGDTVDALLLNAGIVPGDEMKKSADGLEMSFAASVIGHLMPVVGPVIGWDQPVSKGAKRYIDVLDGGGNTYVNGRTYTSAPKKLVGPLYEVTYDHLLDVERQDAAWGVLGELSGTTG